MGRGVHSVRKTTEDITNTVGTQGIRRVGGEKCKKGFSPKPPTPQPAIHGLTEEENARGGRYAPRRERRERSLSSVSLAMTVLPSRGTGGGRYKTEVYKFRRRWKTPQEKANGQPVRR